jgi:hypothetical protein
MKRVYKVIDRERMNSLGDYRVKCRDRLPRKTKGLILIDNNDMSRINFDCEINLRKNCWELYIYDENIAKDTKRIAEDMDAVAYS